MKIRGSLVVRGVLMLFVLIILALAVRFTLAQAPGPGSDFDAMSRNETTGPVYNVIPIQGYLTDENDTPIDGYRVITFSLYANSYDTVPLCQDDDSVSIDEGQFTAEMDWCDSSDIDGKRLYLGIQVEGEDEMNPREPIYPVPYAFSLRPGAIISGSTSNAIVHIENWYSHGRGLRAYAMSESGTNYGVVGASQSPDGYGGYFYNNEGGTALYGKAGAAGGVVYGIHGVSHASEGRGVVGEGLNASGGVGVEGSSTIGSGVYAHSSNGYGVYASTDAAGGNYGVFTTDNIYSANYHMTGAVMQVVQNAGTTSLEPGDVVAFSGISAPLTPGGQPVIQVTGAAAANSTAVAGVVCSRYEAAALADPAGPANPARDRDVTPDGAAAPGDTLLIVVRGPAQVKASAVSGALQPGDLLSSAGQVGVAAKAAQVSLSGADVAIPGTVLGKALEPLGKGEGLIYMYVTLQ